MFLILLFLINFIIVWYIYFINYCYSFSGILCKFFPVKASKILLPSTSWLLFGFSLISSFSILSTFSFGADKGTFFSSIKSSGCASSLGPFNFGLILSLNDNL